MTQPSSFSWKIRSAAEEEDPIEAKGIPLPTNFSNSLRLLSPLVGVCWSSSGRQGGRKRDVKGEGAGRDKWTIASAGRQKRKGERIGMEVEGVLAAVTGSLWLRCLVYHNTRPWAARTGGCTGTLLETVAMYQRTVKTPSWTAADPVRSKDCAANTRDILSSLLSPISACIADSVTRSRTCCAFTRRGKNDPARICWKLCMDVGYGAGRGGEDGRMGRRNRR